MSRRSRHRRKGGFLQSILVGLLAGLLLSVVVIRWVNRQLRPILILKAESALQELVFDTVNQLVEEDIEAGNIQYEDMVNLSTNEAGEIIALSCNMAELNRLRARILLQLGEVLDVLENTRFQIPLGSFLRNPFSAGKGFTVPMEVVSSTSFSAEFFSDFTEAGINQTRHQIELQVYTDLEILLPGGMETVEANTRVVVADTVLMGKTPENYAIFEDSSTSDEAVENYLHLNRGTGAQDDG